MTLGLEREPKRQEQELTRLEQKRDPTGLEQEPKEQDGVTSGTMALAEADAAVPPGPPRRHQLVRLDMGAMDIVKWDFVKLRPQLLPAHTGPHKQRK